MIRSHLNTYVRIYARLVFLLILVLFTAPCVSAANGVVPQKYRIDVRFMGPGYNPGNHAQPPHRESTDIYFDCGNDSVLVDLVREFLTNVLVTRIDDYHLSEYIQVVSGDPVPDGANSIVVYVWIDDRGGMNIAWDITAADGSLILSRRYERISRELAFRQVSEWDRLRDICAHDDPTGASLILRDLAIRLTGKIDTEIAGWLVQKSVRIRVAVNSFQDLGHDSSTHHLSIGLRRMVESELSRSKAIVVYDHELDSVSLDGTIHAGSASPLNLNYIITGSFFKANDEVRIDMQCVKLPARRVLTSARTNMKHLSLNELSNEVAEASSRLRAAMLSDFTTTARTMAILADPPVRYFLSAQASKDATQIAKIISRNFTSKMKVILERFSDSDAMAQLTIRDISASLDEYGTSLPSPGQILADHNLDYLVLVHTEDLGNQMRLSPTLYSFDQEMPSTASPISPEEAHQNRLELAIDRTIFKIIEKLCYYHVLSTPKLCTDQNREEIEKSIEYVRMMDIRRKKSFSIAFGLSDHDNKKIYLDNESTEFIEFTFSHLLPDFFLPADFRNDVEFVLGYDFGSKFKIRKGAFSSTALLNYKLNYGFLQYSSFPIVLNAGVGAGFIKLTYRFSADERPYIGLSDYKKSIVKPAANIFIGFEMPLFDRLGFVGTMRRIFSEASVETFREFPTDESIQFEPDGNLSNWVFVGGLRYVWR